MPLCPVEVEVGVVEEETAGHSANSHRGPVRPTDEPSGQSIASSVQAIGLGGEDTWVIKE